MEQWIILLSTPSAFSGVFVRLIGENASKERRVHFKKTESTKFYLPKKLYFPLLLLGKKDYYIS